MDGYTKKKNVGSETDVLVGIDKYKSELDIFDFISIKGEEKVARREDLTGKVFGKLTAIEYMGLDETKKYAMWKCKCECGIEIITRKISLKSGGSQSCGCTNKVNKYRKDLTGQVFERLIVIEYAGYEPKSKSTLWKCKCECGKEIISQKHALINGRTKSCGCLTRYSKGDNITHGLSGNPVYSV